MRFSKAPSRSWTKAPPIDERHPAGSLRQYFKALSEKQISSIIVGGQAVNLWATVYEAWDKANNPEPIPLSQYRSIYP